jgi:hypothetical protein
MMLLTTLSAGAIVHSTVRALSSVHWHFKEKNQHTTINMDENGSGAAALGGGIGHWLKIAAAALGGGGGRRTCNDGIGIDIGINVVKAEGLLLRHWHQHQQGWQERMHPMQGTYINGDGKEIGILRWQWWW